MCLEKMIKWIIIFLANLEQKVRDIRAKREKYYVEKSYKQLKKEYAHLKAKAPSSPSVGERIRNSPRNIKNIVRNTVDGSPIGGVIHKYQDYKTTRHFKKNPNSEIPIVYMKQGLFQNRGQGWRQSRTFRKAGYMPLHSKTYNNLSREEHAEKTYEQIEKFQKRTKLKNPEKRTDILVGHSSGGDMGVYMAGDKRTKQYGIKKVYAIAPAPAGIEAKTLGQKLLMPLAGEDNVKHYKGRKSVVELHRRKPKIPVHVIAGKYDDLVTPRDAAYKYAKKHYVIDHPDSTHFGTSGGNEEMNKIIVELIKQDNKYKRHYKKAA